MSALLSLSGLRKAYPGVVANDDVSLEIAQGEVHALLGENGAGKSTLVKMIYGLVAPDSGEMRMEGATFQPTDPRAARAAGVGMVFQHFSLFDALSVAENIALGMDDPPKMRDLAGRIRDVSVAYGLPLSPERIVGTLSAGERQRVEIIRCLLGNPKLLIMDEPTSVLTPQEADILFGTLRKLAQEGTAILYISHKLEEIRALCDKATILRGGRVVGGCIPSESSAREMGEMMVGRAFRAPARKATAPGEVLLEIRGLSRPSASPFGIALRDVNLEVRAGEVVGIGGVAGNGQDELLGVLSGETTSPAGSVFLQGADVGAEGTEARRAKGFRAAPEERLGHAAAPGMSLSENALLTGQVHEKLVRGGMLDWRRTRGFAERIIEAFDVRTPGPETAAGSLSGGNLQKFVIGREVLQTPKVLVVNQPTWGVDAAAASAIRQALMDLAAAGAAVVVISQDLDELMEISDRFAALNEGRLSALQETAALNVEAVGLLLGGAHGMEQAAGVAP